MTAKTKAQLYTEIDTNYPDNTSGLITPAIQRMTEKDTIDSWQQAPSVNAQIGSAYTVTIDDFGKLVTFNSAVPVGVTLPQATGAFSVFNVMLANIGTGTVTITPITSTIGGAASLNLLQRQCQTIVSDGANYQLAQNTSVGVAGSGNFPVFNDTINGLVIRPIVSTDLPACQFAGLGAVKAKAQVAGQVFTGLDEGGAFLTSQSREVLGANRNYFVRSDPVAVSMALASPGVVTWTSHGFIANQEVYFSIRPMRSTFTVTIATPGVITWTAHGMAAGQPFTVNTVGPNVTTPAGLLPTGLVGTNIVTISTASPGVVTRTAHGLIVGQAFKFVSNGVLPNDLATGVALVRDRPYYVIAAGFGANSFQFASTPGGAAINTGGSPSGTHWVTPIYYVIATGLSTNSFQFAATPPAVGSAAVNTTGSQSGTHYGQRDGTMPVGLTEGIRYFVVGASITTHTFQVSATSGGAAVNFTVSTEGQIWGQFGSDTFDGLSAVTPFGTIQKAIDVTSALDFSIFTVTTDVKSGTYATGAGGATTINLKSITGDVATLRALQGAIINHTNTTGITANTLKGRWVLDGFTTNLVGGGGFIGINVARGSNIDLNNHVFGAAGNAHLVMSNNASVTFNGTAYTIIGPAPIHLNVSLNASLVNGGKTVTILNTPQFPSGFCYCDRSGVVAVNANTYSGPVAPSTLRYNVLTNGTVDTQGGGATYFPGDTAGSTDASGVYA